MDALSKFKQDHAIAWIHFIKCLRSNTKDQEILNPVLACSQISPSNDFDSHCAVVQGEIKDRDHHLSRFIEIFHEKPQAKSLASVSSKVKILCSLWKQFKIVDGILYRAGKTDIDLWRLIRFYWPYMSESHNYNTRSSTCWDIKLANPSNNQLMRTFKYNSAKLWNALDISVRGNPP